MVAFQEKTEGAGISNWHTSVPRKKSMHLYVDQEQVRTLSIDAKREPPLFEQNQESEMLSEADCFTSHYLNWITMRKQNGFDQIIPAFSGWRIKLRKESQLLYRRRLNVTYHLSLPK